MSFNLNQKYVFITGGSSGLGLAIAQECVLRNAHVIICARHEASLLHAIALLKTLSTNDTQLINYVQADCTDYDSISKALHLASELITNYPLYLLVCNVGHSDPKTFLNHTSLDFATHMQLNYLSAVYTTHAALKILLQRSQTSPIQAKLVFVSSLASWVTFTGYSAYSPSKSALNMFVNALRHEFLGGPCRDVTLHTFLPGSIDTEGFQREQLVKPISTKTLELNDPILSPRQCANCLFEGLDAGKELITTNFNGEMLRALNKGQVPAHSSIWDAFLALIAWFGLIIWRRTELIPIGKKMPAIPFNHT